MLGVSPKNRKRKYLSTTNGGFMKTQYISGVVAICILLVSFSQAKAGDNALSQQQIPNAVTDAFKKVRPNTKGLTYKVEMFEGKKAYELEFKENGK